MSNGGEPLPTRLTEKKQASLLRKIVRPHPNRDAWKLLYRLAILDFADRADFVVAQILGRALDPVSPSKQLSTSHSLGRLLAGSQNKQLTEALARQEFPGGRHLALSILEKWPAVLPDSLFKLLEELLADRLIPTRAKFKFLKSFTSVLGPENRNLGKLFYSFIRGRSKKRSIKFLRGLKKLIGNNTQLEAILKEIEDQVRMDCPRCGIQLPQREMVHHLWTVHELLLEGHRVREPWSFIEDWIEEYRRHGNAEILDQCRTLASRMDSGQSSVRLERYLIQNELDTESSRGRLVQLSNQLHSAICPWCFALEPQPANSPPSPVFLRDGLLTSTGFLVDLSEDGWQTALKIRTNDRLIYQGKEPNWPWTGKGLATWIALGAVLIALGCAVGFNHYPKKPFFLVIGLLLLAFLVWYWLPQIWQRMRRPLSERTRYYTWTILIPDLIQHPIGHLESAFICGILQIPLSLPVFNIRQKMFPHLIKAFEKGVRVGDIPSKHLAVLHRQRINEAFIQDADPIHLVLQILGSCLSGKLPMQVAEDLLNRWETDWWTPGNLERLRVLLCDQAFEMAYEVQNLLDLGQTVPSLATILKTRTVDQLAALRLLWSQRSSVPWERCGKVRTVFDLAKDPGSSQLLAQFPDLLLWQQQPDWPPVRQKEEDPFEPIQILFCSRGLICQASCFARMPSQIEMRTHFRQYELRIDDQVFLARKPLDNLEHRLLQWFRYAFQDFYPLVGGVPGWSTPDRATLFRAWGAHECRECHHFYFPRVGSLGISPGDEATSKKATGKENRPAR